MKISSIRIGSYYRLELHLVSENESPKVLNYADVTCYTCDKETTLCIEPEKGIYKLYYSPNLSGLCYHKKQKQELY